ncbi:MAG TPA: class I SAM-dependent methyltransferase [Actinomycetota bacterium]|jgi:ubiquinone/menaquinone biosynthesis C-methylase UbiE
MSREDVRTNLASWEADSAAYQERNAEQLDRWDRLAWGIWDVPEDEIRALGDVDGALALELGCGACQFGIRVARRGARVVGLDFSANQLATGRRKMEETGTMFPLVRADAEQLPFADGVFDLVFCDHGATSFTDPSLTIPEAARVLRAGGRLVFNIASPFIWTFWGPDDEPPTRELRRPYFDGGRTVWDDEDGPSVEWQLTYGDWIRVFRASDLIVDDLVELRPDAEATTTYTTFASRAWARDFPGEALWKLVKA